MKHISGFNTTRGGKGMMSLIYGAVGMLAVLGLLAVGAFLGWKVTRLFDRYRSARAQEEVTQEQRRQLVAQQQAFEEMLRYNQDTAYGLAAGLGAMQGGEEA